MAAIYLTLQQHEDKNSYAFVNFSVPCICIAKNLKAWAMDEMRMTPDRFARRVAGIVAHETLHVVLDELIHDGFKTSQMLDNLFGKVYRDDLTVHGLWDLDEMMKVYGNENLLFSSEET